MPVDEYLPYTYHLLFLDVPGKGSGGSIRVCQFRKKKKEGLGFLKAAAVAAAA